MEQVEKSTGKTPEGLILPEFPYLLLHLWEYFIELSRVRGTGMSGPAPISYSEIKTWSELTGNNVSVKDVEIITKLDRLFIEVNSG